MCVMDVLYRGGIPIEITLPTMYTTK
jgi:hypothetical protein